MQAEQLSRLRQELHTVWSNWASLMPPPDGPQEEQYFDEMMNIKDDHLIDANAQLDTVEQQLLREQERLLNKREGEQWGTAPDGSLPLCVEPTRHPVARGSIGT